MSVFVAGALHLDVVVETPHLPRLDETATGTAVSYQCGGKGGNQAMAAARMGAQVAMAGRVGSDGFGATLLAGLQAAGVDVSHVVQDAGASGMSVALLQPDGGYGAVIVSAANLRIDPHALRIPIGTSVLLLQNEIPAAVNLAAATKARWSGAKVILNAAPARALDPALLALVDVLVVNRIEAADMLGLPDLRLDAPKAAARLQALGPACVIITLGGDGLILADRRISHHPGHNVPVISTHGAGDAFLGALAARLDAGDSLGQATAFGQAAAALHVSTPVDQRGEISPAQVATLYRGVGA